MSDNDLHDDRWMQSLNPIIKDIPLTDIVFPGVHHPASYSFFTGNTGKYVTQDTTFYTQLMNGIRYFDSRPTVNKNNQNQLVEYHGSNQASFGASYNTILRQFKDYFSGYNRLMDFGSSPTVLSLEAAGTPDRFAVIYHSQRLTELSNDSTEDSDKSVFSTRLFCITGTFENASRKVQWQAPRAYNFGMTPDAAITSDGLIVEVHQSQDNDSLYYTLGRILNGEPTFNLSAQEKYTTGQQPSIGQITKGGVPCFLEVHKSQNDDTLWYGIFTPDSEHTSLKKLSSGKVSVSSEIIMGHTPTQVAIPDSNQSLVFFTDNSDSVMVTMASFKDDKISFDTPVAVGISGSNVSAVKMMEQNGSLQIAVSVKSQQSTYTNRSYAIVYIDSEGSLTSCKVTDFGDDYPTWNAETSGLFYHSKSQSLLSFESDADLLANIWYQPLSFDGNKLKLEQVDSGDSKKTKEFCILGLWHSKLSTNTDLERFQALVNHFLPGMVVPYDTNIRLDIKPLNYYLDKSQQLLIVLNQNPSDLKNYPVFWPKSGYLNAPWHSKGRPNSSYYRKIKQHAEERTDPDNKSLLYVLQTHLTSNGAYSQLLNWDYDYEPVSNSYLTSLTEVLLSHNVNIIESNMLTHFLTGFAIYLNTQKFGQFN